MTRTRLLSVVLLALVTGLAAAPGESLAAACASVAGIDSEGGIGGTGIAETDSGSGGTGIAETDSGIGGTGIAETDSGIGGTGIDDPDSGIGGTGIAETDNGSGGTGIAETDSGIGGTGIFGTITGFASVCINGLEIHYDDDVPVTENGEPASAADLALGQVVWIVSADRSGSLVATSISILRALVGEVERVDPESGSFRVNGENVEVPPSALVLGQAGGPIELGARVEVSGLRRPDGRVVASRVDLARSETPRTSMPTVAALLRTAPGLSHLSIEGFAGTRVGADRFDLDGIEIEVPRELPRGAGAGFRVTVEGSLREGVLRADRMTVDRIVTERPERPPKSDPRPAPKSLRLERPPRIERPEVLPRPDRPIRPFRPEPFKPDVRP